MITEDVVEKVELTDTQMMYIEQSESSYLNTQRFTTAGYN